MTKMKEGPDRNLPPEDRLLVRLSWCCRQFRVHTYIGSEKSLPWLLQQVGGLLSLFPYTNFAKGIRLLGLNEFTDKSRAVFFCLCERFIASPLCPVDSSSFESIDAQDSFENGMDALVGKGLVIAVAVNNPDNSKASKDNYLLSPEVCGKLFHGREELIRPTVIAQFGSIITCKDIRERTLIFPEDLRDRLRLVSRAVAADHFDQVVRELTENGLRGGVTALLYGPPGTGKTEFVRQLARSTGRNILQVDCAKLDATYYGEKPRNMRDFFRLVRYASAISLSVPIVFVDEADGFFGRRVQVEKAADKEENTTANIILEELNTFTGILLAATNNIANLDPAMNRRFLLKVEFPVPDLPTLARIWQSKLPWLTPDEAGTLAGRFPLCGGVIDNVVSLCLLEKIINGKEPSLERILRLCAEQGAKRRTSIGFGR